MLIDQLMTTRVVSVQMDDKLSVVKEIFDNTHFHHLVVIEHGRLVGMVSDRDLFKALSPNLGTASETDKDKATLNRRVHQIMSRKPVTIRPTADTYEAVSLYNSSGVSCLPVTDDDGKVVGILSWRDLFRALEERQTKKARKGDH
ncbi:MAG: CBS domain-containing protein [Thalassolituus sp.]|jgi:acetoin utilization protein AcuB|uniref:CBS domain-containing protein n=1 Tax=Thalassolituus sp. TaxID=2030822 RepID=UPI0026218C42|nr:CBS domain-containing protein [uncultured Thalassolituus sp.]TNC84386.1 MAG: CBS domain-containing protein [Thalassolituus sp.]TNC92609.1 MAG: CBS domain-containing protein [Thalassolituus sp.]